MAWNIQNKEKYQLFSPTFSEEQELSDALLVVQTAKNKIVDISLLTLTDASVALLAKVYEYHVARQVSFIVVVSSFENLDRLEEYFIVVPSISEAIDYIYMEELERNV